MKDIYTPDDLALRWGCCVQVVYTLLRSRKLMGFKVGNQWRVTTQALQKFEGGQTA
jgi:hypothetical protein